MTDKKKENEKNEDEEIKELTTEEIADLAGGKCRGLGDGTKWGSVSDDGTKDGSGMAGEDS